MIDFTELLGDAGHGSALRYARECSNAAAGAREGAGPVVVWNITNECNYHCRHCYSNAARSGGTWLTTQEACQVIDDLAEIKVPVILFSGGEPLLRQDLFQLIAYARDKGIKISLSTNGSLLTKDVARNLKRLGVSYAGISLDGTPAIHDWFRGKKGAYQEAIAAVRHCLAEEQKVGLRFTLHKKNYREVEKVLELAENMAVPRICFYHLVPAGRGKGIMEDALSNQETRAVVDLLYEYVNSRAAGNPLPREILTVDNHADGVYIYLRMKQEDPRKAERILTLLSNNGGNRSGVAIANIDWEGNVHPDQFFRYVLGNVKETPFSALWLGAHPFLRELRNRKGLLKGRCRQCRWLKLCNGNLRGRAYGIYHDPWAEDPGCYLTDEEICNG